MSWLWLWVGLALGGLEADLARWPAPQTVPEVATDYRFAGPALLQRLQTARQKPFFGYNFIHNSSSIGKVEVTGGKKVLGTDLVGRTVLLLGDELLDLSGGLHAGRQQREEQSELSQRVWLGAVTRAKRAEQ